MKPLVIVGAIKREFKHGEEQSKSLQEEDVMSKVETILVTTNIGICTGVWTTFLYVLIS